MNKVEQSMNISLVIDAKRGVCLLNGEDISRDASELHLDFENGTWSLTVMRSFTYTASAKITKE